MGEGICGERRGARGGGRADAETRADGGGTRARGDAREISRSRATRGTGSGESGRRAPARCAVMDGR